MLAIRADSGHFAVTGQMGLATMRRALGMLVGLAGLFGAGAALADPAPVVTIDEAKVSGIALDHAVHAWLGLRYAKPPTGAARWRRSLLSHLTGAIDATHYGAACPQGDYTNRWYRRMAVAMGSDADAVGPGPKFDEDCLFLNVWAPAKKANGGAPVMASLNPS